MSYSVAVTSAGQMTIPKTLREMLGITDRVVVDREKDKIVVRREKTAEEILDELHASFTPEERKIAKSYGGRLAKDILNEYYQTEEYQKRMKEEYGI